MKKTAADAVKRREDAVKRREAHRHRQSPAPVQVPVDQPYPCLFYPGKRNQIFCTISNPTKTYHRRIPKLQNKRYLTICFGWCLFLCPLTNNWHRLFLWNPVTLEKIKLQQLNTKEFISYAVLSSPPTESGTSCCRVILFTKELPLIIYCGVGDEEWTKLDYFKQLKRSLWGRRFESKYRLHNPFWCNGHLYATLFRNIVKIHDFQPNSLKIEFLSEVPENKLESLVNFNRYLIESCGELFIIQIVLHVSFKHVVAIELHRFDFSEKVWLTVKSAKDRAFFVMVGCRWGFSYPAYSPEIEGNRVYFTLARDDHKNLYAYNIEDGDISVSSAFLNLPKLHPPPMWVMPDLRLATTSKEAQHSIHMEEQQGGEVHGKVNDLRDLEETNDANEVHLPYLPYDLVELIFQRLFLVDYLHFRATSKMFNSAAPLIPWRISSQRFENLSLSPWLTLFNQKDGACAFIDPNYGDKYFINLPQTLKESMVICSTKDGWLLMTVGDDDYESLFLFNPFTQVILPLPGRRERIQNFSCIGFSSLPSSSECVVVEVLVDKKSSFPIFNHGTLGDDCWYECTTDDAFIFNNSPVFYRGAFYYLGQKGNLGIFELCDGGYIWDVPTKPKPPCTCYTQNYLVECNGELLSVFVGHFGKWVRVFKLNESKKTWIGVESLGNYMFYVSRSSPFSAKAKSPEMVNKIYFPRFCGKNNVFYSLETGKYHTRESKDVVDFYSSREKLSCGWIGLNLGGAR